MSPRVLLKHWCTRGSNRSLVPGTLTPPVGRPAKRLSTGSIVKSLAPSKHLTRAIAGILAFIVSVAILSIALWPTPLMGLDRHWARYSSFAVCAAMFMGIGLVFVGRRFRLLAGLASVLAIGWTTLVHPVCVLIPDAQRPSFESVMPLSVRAAQGEPFCQFGGHWYQCKSFITRAFFF